MPIVLIARSCQRGIVKLPFVSLVPSYTYTYTRPLSGPRSPSNHRCSVVARVLSTRMSDDASYKSFLDKANADTGASKQPAKAPTATSSSSADVPPALKKVNATYTSDTDSPFEPVNLDEGAFNDGAEEMSVQEWDPRGEYGEVVRAVEGVVEGGKVTVYRVEKGRTRVEYYVVGVKGGKMVGVVAKAVES